MSSSRMVYLVYWSKMSGIYQGWNRGCFLMLGTASGSSPIAYVRAPPH